jgi:subtilase family serine protease
MAYTFIPWFVLIFALSGILSKQHQRNDVSQRNKSYAFALLIISCILFIIRLGLFIIRYMRRKVPTVQDP